jgi:hypothetical protein
MSNPKKKVTNSPSTTSSTDSAALAQVMALLGPLVDFHKKVGAAGPEDLRIYWDVRVIRGEDEPFMSTSGNSTLPGCLSEKQQANASTIIQQEVHDKIAVPLVGRIQKFVEEENAMTLELRAREPLKVGYQGDVEEAGADQVQLLARTLDKIENEA